MRQYRLRANRCHVFVTADFSDAAQEVMSGYTVRLHRADRAGSRLGSRESCLIRASTAVTTLSKDLYVYDRGGEKRV